MYLTGVKDRNEQIFYRVLTENFKDVAPIVYGAERVGVRHYWGGVTASP